MFYLIFEFFPTLTLCDPRSLGVVCDSQVPGDILHPPSPLMRPIGMTALFWCSSLSLGQVRSHDIYIKLTFGTAPCGYANSDFASCHSVWAMEAASLPPDNSLRANSASTQKYTLRLVLTYRKYYARILYSSKTFIWLVIVIKLSLVNNNF